MTIESDLKRIADCLQVIAVNVEKVIGGASVAQSTVNQVVEEFEAADEKEAKATKPVTPTKKQLPTKTQEEVKEALKPAPKKPVLAPKAKTIETVEELEEKIQDLFSKADESQFEELEEAITKLIEEFTPNDMADEEVSIANIPVESFNNFFAEVKKLV
jgi:GTPase SAR1 family protein